MSKDGNRPIPFDTAVDSVLEAKRAAEAEADRLEVLLDLALEALRARDGPGAALCLQEALESAQRLPKATAGGKLLSGTGGKQ